MPEPAVISGTCPECRQDLEHCHGTAIEHCDGSADCSDDPNCQLPGRAAPVPDLLRRRGLRLRPGGVPLSLAELGWPSAAPHDRVSPQPRMALR